MIEVAALAKPSCFGPHTNNFAEAVELLTTGGGAIIVHDSTELQQTLAQWLNNPAAAHSMGHRAQDLIRQQQGSTQKYVQRLLNVLPIVLAQPRSGVFQ
jgi:3-deoxy-D-manno-octulosonic-acid transferase